MSAKVEIVVPGLSMDEIFGDLPAAPAPVADPKAKAKKPRGKKAVKPGEAVTEGSAEGEVAEPTTPKATVKRSRPSKKNATPGAVTPGPDGEEAAAETPTKTPAIKTPKKRATPGKANGETPAKKAKASSFPTCWEEFSEEDKLIVNMRRGGSAWQAIETEWEKITKRNPGKDVIRKRFAKLEAVAQVFKAGDAAILAAAKIKVETAIEEQIKKLRADKWSTIAAQMKEDGADGYKPAAIEKKFEFMVKNGDVNAAGDYIGREVNGNASGSDKEDAVADGEDTEMKDAAEAKVETDVDADGEADEEL